jgi:AcrR family transcriptional regulator
VTDIVLAAAPTAGPRSRKGVQTRARLLEAAKAVFEEQGFLDTRISDISKRAGLSHGSFYHYFDSKEHIFHEVVALIDDELLAGLNLMFDRTYRATPPERLHEALRIHFEAYRNEARMMGVIEEVGRHDEQIGTLRNQRREERTRRVARSIRQLQQHGLADPLLDPMIAAAAVSAMTQRFAERWFVEGFPDCSFETGLDQFTRVFVNALGLRHHPETS